ncbi:MAG: N-acetylglucosamine-6-phosphate deacetylase [Spirochaetota bacterium]
MKIPGFVDVQVNGYAAIDFSDPSLTDESLAQAADGVLSSGTAGFLPTIITSPMAVYERNIPLIVRMMRTERFRGRILGLHLEGPFISKEPGAVGAHDPGSVIPPSTDALDRLIALSEGTIRLITIAAEVQAADALCRYAVSKGITVSLGHELASYPDMVRLRDAGARALTHLGNGVPNMLPRHDNPIWAGAAIDGLSAMLITDGHHLPPPVITALIRAKGVANVVITSDASPLAGMPPGEYHTLGNRAVLEPSGKLHNPDKGCLVGSSVMMLACANHLNSLGIVTAKEIVLMGLDNPLALIGLSRKSLAPVKKGVRYEGSFIKQ